ncbi:hypothetical protein BKA93DRAFT_570528 [Sparassis latifolia]|uniref:54S ribosomal protein L36, mitochondrial n=1 Tax=Sparassis crispa TaxID=139825 RepID=A0A401GYQ6_9APHY|nr:54S ribosomal protein L36, mitochondrial [Sparassis crispa]GBE87294.1 54S ribosomal protein L36, mitochondrial [Sparassis crispa]
MSFPSALASTSRCLKRTALSQRATPVTQPQTRGISSSPYGRTHVWKHRQRKLPNPFVPQFPQRVVRADGSTFIHYTTSPRSVFRLTRDTTNNPLWNAARWTNEGEEEDLVTGRLGRFNRRFDGMGGHASDVDWMSESEGSGEAKEIAKEAARDIAEQSKGAKGRKR